MKQYLNTIRNKWRQYYNRVFLSDSNNNQIWYKHLMLYILNLDSLFNKKLKFEQPFIVVVSDNLLMKILLFMYSFITNSDLVLISPKFSTAAIVNAIISRRGTNVLIIDKSIEGKIILMEQEEGINILKYFKYVDTTNSLVEKLMNDNECEEEEIHLNRLYRKGLRNVYSDVANCPISKLSILSPGTVNEPCFVNVPYEILFKSMQMMSYFLGLKAGDKITVIADFEFFPNVFTILGFLNGLHIVQPIEDIQSAEDFVDQFRNCNSKQSIVIITSQKFKLIWDSILLSVHNNRLVFKLSKCRLLSWIPTCLILRKLSRVFGKTVINVHILNEELGVYCLNTLKHSRIWFTSSYGYLEQGNFLAFKDPSLFKNKNFYCKPGGSVLKESDELFKRVRVEEDLFINCKIGNNYVGEIVAEANTVNGLRVMKSEDLGMEIPNIESQGSRKYIYVLGRKNRYSTSSEAVNLDLIEKMIKDTLLIKDCFLIKVGGGYRLYIEPREKLFDVHHIEWNELVAAVNVLIKDLKDNKSIKIIGSAILRFDGFRNIAGKLQYYTLR